MRVWLCEKPSQASDIASVLGAARRGQGVIETSQGTVTWALGHLLELAPPEHYDPANKEWRVDRLPIVPPRWNYVPIARSRAQLRIIDNLLRSASEVVIATDADREGETIAREVLERAGYAGRVRRLWLRALDPESIRNALAALRDDAETIGLHWAAQGRARADWLVGLNLTRAISKVEEARGSDRGVRSVGRVQTPTLGLVVRRDREIEAFVAREYFELSAVVTTDAGKRVVMRHAPHDEARIFDRAKADHLASMAQGARGSVEVEITRERQGPPPLLDLAGFQSACNRLFGWSADRALSIAQSLYETHKVTSYPRTDCTYLPEEQMADVPKVLASIAAAHVDGLGTILEEIRPVLRANVFASAKVTAHHAIIPLAVAVDRNRLGDEEAKAYDLIARHYVASLLPDYEYDQTRMRFDANGVLFTASGRVARAPGWKAALGGRYQESAKEDDENGTQEVPVPDVPDGASGVADPVVVEGLRTKPPRPYTEGTLLKDMKSAAKYATDPEVKARLKETSGIGTSATRAAIIKTLRDRGYIATKGRSIVSTAIGRALIDCIPPELADVALTAVWETRLDEIANGKVGEHGRDRFLASVESFTKLMLGRVLERMPAADEVHERVPSPKQLAVAESIARRVGMTELPAQARASAAACSAFIDQHRVPEAERSDVPSEAQLKQLDRLERDRGLIAPPEARASRKACSAYLDSVFGQREMRPSSRKRGR